MECRRCNVVSKHIKKAGFFKNRNGAVQRYYCPLCRKSFSISNNNGMRIEKKKIHTVIKLLCETGGIRSTSRLTGLHQATILKVLKLSGLLAKQFTDQNVKNLKCDVVAADEVYAFVQKKEHNKETTDPLTGSQYCFMAVDIKSKFIISSVTGQRTAENAVQFLSTLKNRVTGRIQLNTDAWTAYAGRVGHKSCIKTVFGDEIDHLTEQKYFYQTSQFISKKLAKTERRARIGNPDIMKGSTSCIERTNLTLRNLNRRFTRCTLGFSKKLINLRHSMELFLWNFNFVRKHGTIKTTPAIYIGVSTAIMTVSDLWK